MRLFSENFMRRAILAQLFLFSALNLLTTASVAAQSSSVAVVHAASYDAAVAPGSIAALFGQGLSATTHAAESLPLPAALGNVSVNIGGRPAPLFFVSPQQINLQIPAQLNAGNAQVEVFINGASVAAFSGTADIVDAAPGLFTLSASGQGQAAALNADYSLNAEFELRPGARPALAGSVVVLFATGIGTTQPPVADGHAAPASSPAMDTGAPTVAIGGVNARVLFSGLTPGLVGVWQLNVLLPEALPTNLATPIRISKGRESLAAALAVAGKNDFGALSGVVTDGLSGARLAHATVTLPQTNNVTRTTRADAQGVFNLPVVRVGSQMLQASAREGDGFQTETQSVNVVANATATVNFTLAKQRPNVVVIVADDLGYADLGVQGSTEIVTPHIDSIARNGVRFTQGYANAPVCNATRAALLTGRYQQRFGVETLAATNLPTNETTLAERLQPLGYATALIGKWHLGTAAQFQPQQRGYAEFFGFLPALHSYTVWNQPGNLIYRGTTPVNENTYLTDALTREAVDFIERKRQQPFYLYLAFNAPHSPLQATAEYLARFPNITNQRRRTFAAMMAAMDDGVGKVLAKLREHHLEENTLVIFHGDNGGDPSDNTSLNTPFNGEKFQLYEGGIRVPVLAQWRGYLPTSVVNDAPVISLDWFTTAASAAAGRNVAEARLDGVNLFPLLKGVTNAPPHTALYWRYGSAQYAVRAGDWKLLWLDGALRLYDLAADVGERNDVAAAQPGRLNELKMLYDQWNAQLPPAP
jgi:uncharacterized protein (TIGR03437 family)